MKKVKEFTDWNTLKSVYCGLIQPHFDCCEDENSISTVLSDRLQNLG